MRGQIIAAGGLALSTEPRDRVMFDYILKIAGKPNPKVCFLPQAGAENKEYIVKFYEVMLAFGAQPSWQSLYGRVENGWEARILEQDVIYVGGGNTRSMIALWREWGMDEVLLQAAANGTILAGVSAGAICWFEQCITDSVWPLGTIPGLGWLSGSACPHYDGEPERRPTTMQMVAQGRAQDGLALCDYAAAHYIDGERHAIITTQPQAKAFYLTRDGDECREEELPVGFIG